MAIVTDLAVAWCYSGRSGNGVVGADIVELIIKNKKNPLLRVWPSSWLPLVCDAKVAGVATVGLVIAES